MERPGTSFTGPWAVSLLALSIAVFQVAHTTNWPGIWNRSVWAFLILNGFPFTSDERFSRAHLRHIGCAPVLGIAGYLLNLPGEEHRPSPCHYRQHLGGRGLAVRRSGGMSRQQTTRHRVPGGAGSTPDRLYAL